jgi:dTDP-glucose pyrophosphorylase
MDAVDGYLEVFEGEGRNWSFVAPRDPDIQSVARTTEKDPISNLCCTGLYQFRRVGDFREAFAAAAATGSASWSAGELYVAPLYNRLIANGRDIRYHLIARDEVILCGTPDEYHAVLSAPP